MRYCKSARFVSQLNLELEQAMYNFGFVQIAGSDAELVVYQQKCMH